MAHEAKNTLGLPVSIVSRTDVGRLHRELKTLDEFLQQAAIRQPGTATKLPRTSRLMDEFLQINKLNALVEDDRKGALAFLDFAYKHAPVIHMSFNADPSPLFSQRLITWMRDEIHPQVLIQSGLQPSIGAGCTVRVASKHFDFSLREHFKSKREILIQQIAKAATDAQ